MPRRLPSKDAASPTEGAFTIDDNDKKRILELFQKAGKNIDAIGSVYVAIVINAPVDELEPTDSSGSDCFYVYDDNDANLLVNQMDNFVLDSKFNRVVGCIPTNEIIFAKNVQVEHD